MIQDESRIFRVGFLCELLNILHGVSKLSPYPIKLVLKFTDLMGHVLELL